MDNLLYTRKPGEGLEQLAIPFDGQKLYHGYCKVCWDEDLIDGPHLVGLCLRCREEADKPEISWEENIKIHLETSPYASFDEYGNCYYCEHPKELHKNLDRK